MTSDTVEIDAAPIGAPPQVMPSVVRNYRPTAFSKYLGWRKWQSRWRFANILLGGLATLLGAIVAANTKQPFLPDFLAVAIAVLAPVFSFVLTTMKPQAEATAFETASRELEKYLNEYDADPTKDDVFLGRGVSNGIDLLNRIGTS